MTLPALGGGKTHAAANLRPNLMALMRYALLMPKGADTVEAVECSGESKIIQADCYQWVKWSDVFALVDADVALASASSGPQWRDISTAPKDGTRVLCWYPIAAAAFAGSCENEDEMAGPGGEAPTLWMPLPAPPDGSLCATPEKER